MAYDELAEHCLEMLQPLGAVRSRRMFGGHGIYVDDLFIAIIVFDRVFLKADELNRERFEAAGCEPFVYDGAGKKVTVSYFTVPAEAMESPAAMQPWARLALEAALRARAKKPQARPRKAKPKVGAVRGSTRARRA